MTATYSQSGPAISSPVMSSPVVSGPSQGGSMSSTMTGPPTQPSMTTNTVTYSQTGPTGPAMTSSSPGGGMSMSETLITTASTIYDTTPVGVSSMTVSGTLPPASNTRSGSMSISVYTSTFSTATDIISTVLECTPLGWNRTLGWQHAARVPNTNNVCRLAVCDFHNGDVNGHSFHGLYWSAHRLCLLLCLWVGFGAGTRVC
ncbi:hypothetical protein PG989_011952 [Apiospora arundinis]